MMKIYSDDPNLPYKTTKLNAQYTRSEIDGLFGKWGVKDVYWHWDVSARVDCPTVWDHKTRNKAEVVNWNISMRTMFWYIKTHLEAAYLLRSSKAAAFLPDLAGSDEKQTLKDIIIPHISDIQKMAALPKAPIILDQEKEAT